MVVQGERHMARTTKQTKTPATPGFAIEIKDDTELGLAILVAVCEAGGYRPVGVAISVNEAREIAESHQRGYTGPRIAGYDLWAQGLENAYVRLPALIARV
jgi:hypothetical protein